MKTTIDILRQAARELDTLLVEAAQTDPLCDCANEDHVYLADEIVVQVGEGQALVVGYRAPLGAHPIHTLRYPE